MLDFVFGFLFRFFGSVFVVSLVFVSWSVVGVFVCSLVRVFAFGEGISAKVLVL